MNTWQMTVESPIQAITLTATSKGIARLHLGAKDPLKEAPSGAPGFLKATADQLAAYFAGDLKTFDVPLDLQGTPFQKRVWEALLQIPFGQTWSYEQQALWLGNIKLTRAVGAANGRNPVAIIVPCHRVIGKNGTLTGYAGGVDKKQSLLELESGGRLLDTRLQQKPKRAVETWLAM